MILKNKIAKMMNLWHPQNIRPSKICTSTVAVQGLADMLHIDIYIISTINLDMELIRTSYDTPAGIIHLGLIGQFHYQALERMDIHHHAISQSSGNEHDQPNSQPEEHDKEFIEDQEAFQHQAQLRGLPFDTFLQREDTVDVATDSVFSVAPGEGQKPIGILNDKYFEMCNPTKYPNRRYGLVTDRKPSLQCASILTSNCLMLMEGLHRTSSTC